MFNALRNFLLPLLRIPAHPQPPMGAPGSVRVFRAAPNFYRLLLALWALRQLTALFGIAVSLLFLARVKDEVDRFAAAVSAPDEVAPGSSSTATPAPDSVRPPRNHNRFDQQALKAPTHVASQFIERGPWWLFPLIGVLEVAGILFYLAQLPISYALTRLEFESRWYVVTDRSLRIRSGLLSLQETTMSFANLQQVTVSQGPLQRFLGIADVKVQSAGGGGGRSEEPERDSMHTGTFHGVDNAPEVRDLILERLRLFRASGLGDPDDHHETPASPDLVAHSPAGDRLAAARALLTEARALRAIRFRQ